MLKTEIRGSYLAVFSIRIQDVIKGYKRAKDNHNNKKNMRSIIRYRTNSNGLLTEGV